MSRMVNSVSRSARTAAGFTMPEMIIVVAVLAILLSVSAGPLYQFIRQRDNQAEHNAQNDLQKAMATYVENTRQLPTDTIDEVKTDPAYANNWFMQLARFSGLSPQQIRFDSWGNERRYVVYQATQNLIGNSVPIYYATIASAGPDGHASSKVCAAGSGTFTDNSVAGGAINGYLAGTDACWWKNQTNPAAQYTLFATPSSTTFVGSPTDDDVVIKYTDYQAKMDKYQLTLDRLNKIGDALQSYAQQQYANAVAAGTANPTQYIYYPFAGTADVQPTSWYASQVLTDTTTYNGSNSLATLNTNTSLRRTAMVNLMRLLGLPDDTCCNALNTFTDVDGATKEVPFFYTGNPRPRVGGACGSRPDPTLTPTLPARVGTTDPSVATACY